MFLNEFTGGLKDGWVDVPKNKELCDGVAEKPHLQATAKLMMSCSPACL